MKNHLMAIAEERRTRSGAAVLVSSRDYPDGATAPSKKTILTVLEGQEKMINEAFGQFQELRVKCQPLVDLGPVSPTPGECPAPLPTQVLGIIEDHTRQIECLCAQISDLRGAIQL